MSNAHSEHPDRHHLEGFDASALLDATERPLRSGPSESRRAREIWWFRPIVATPKARTRASERG